MSDHEFKMNEVLERDGTTVNLYLEGNGGSDYWSCLDYTLCGCLSSQHKCKFALGETNPMHEGQTCSFLGEDGMCRNPRAWEEGLKTAKRFLDVELIKVEEYIEELQD